MTFKVYKFKIKIGAQHLNFCDFRWTWSTFLDPAVFYSMARLKKLSVRNAPELQIFAVDTLMANTRLEEIHIRDNIKLKSISLDVFSHLPSLQVLNLSNISLRSLKPIEGSRFDQLAHLDISENPLDCNCTVRGLTVAGLARAKISCITHKDDLQADFMLTANSLFGDSSCLTPFTVKIVFLTSLVFILALVFTVSLTVQALYVNRKKKQEQELDSNSLLIRHVARVQLGTFSILPSWTYSKCKNINFFDHQKAILLFSKCNNYKLQL